jgi:antirestriction protein ArdC
MPENRTDIIYSEEERTLPQVSIRMVQERPLISDEVMDSPEAAIRVMSDFLSQMDREMVCVVNLQSNLQPISMNVVSIGALNESAVHPREIMKSAILSNAATFMMIHNHPSGSLEPSRQDIQTTDRMQQVGDLLGIPLIDHIITGRGQKYYSFRENQTLPIEHHRYADNIEGIQLGAKVAEDTARKDYEAESGSVQKDRVQTTALPVQGKDLNSIMQSLEVGVQNFLDGDQDRYKDFLKVMTKFHHYSVNNTLLIAMQRPDATLCNSYKRWQSLGRQVKRGEKGITILAPAPIRAKKTRERKDQYQEPVIGEDGNPEMEEIDVVIPRFKTTTIFAYEQTEGEPLPLLVPEELTASVDNYEIFMEAIQRVSEVPIRFDEISGGAKGYYSSATKEIVINKGMSESQTMKTAIHECAHSLLHDKDIMEANQIEKDRTTKEIEAESCAFCVCAAFNLDTSDYSFPYISGWSKEHDMKELKGSLDVIRKTSGEFIDKITTEMQTIIEERENTTEKEISSLATELDRFAHDFDTYGYNDAVEDTAENIASLEKNLAAGNISGVKQFLQDVVDEADMNTEVDVQKARSLMERLDQVETKIMQDQEPVQGTISFYVAECMEFPVMGEYHEGLTLEEAIQIYERIPSDRIHGIKGIGFDLQDGSFYDGSMEIFSGDKVQYDVIEHITHYKNSPLVQDAVKKLEKYAADKREKNQTVSKGEVLKQQKAEDKPHKKKEAMSL